MPLTSVTIFLLQRTEFNYQTLFQSRKHLGFGALSISTFRQMKIIGMLQLT